MSMLASSVSQTSSKADKMPEDVALQIWEKGEDVHAAGANHVKQRGEHGTAGEGGSIWAGSRLAASPNSAAAKPIALTDMQ